MVEYTEIWPGFFSRGSSFLHALVINSERYLIILYVFAVAFLTSIALYASYSIPLFYQCLYKSTSFISFS